MRDKKSIRVLIKIEGPFLLSAAKCAESPTRVLAPLGLGIEGGLNPPTGTHTHTRPSTLNP